MKKVRPGTPKRVRKRRTSVAPVERESGNSETPRGERQGRGWMLFSLLLLGMFIATVAFPSFIILACGLPPTAVSGLIDSRRARDTLICVLVTNLCGIAPALVRLWAGGNTLAIAMSLLTDPYVWLAMYGAAAVGWCLLWIVPIGAEVALTLVDNERIRQFRRYQNKLVAEWGPGVAGVAEPSLPATRAAGKAKA
jgi:hypothetical protein